MMKQEQRMKTETADCVLVREVREMLESEMDAVKHGVQAGFAAARANFEDELEEALGKLRALDYQKFLVQRDALGQQVDHFLGVIEGNVDVSLGERDLLVRKKRKQNEQSKFETRLAVLPLRCGLCKARIDDFALLKKHYRELHQGSLENNTCTFCKRHFTLPLTLASHYNKNHIEKNIFKCACQGFAPAETKLILKHLLGCPHYMKVPSKTTVKKIE